MNDDPKNKRPATDEDIEREVRQGRKLSAKDLMTQLAGPGAMKGASPVSPIKQAETEIGNWLANNLDDVCGSLKLVLHRQLKGSETLLENLDHPLNAVAQFLRQVIATEELLKEIVREADVEWGRSMDERPYFEREGSVPNLDDPYTIDSVRQAIAGATQKLPIATD